MKRRIEEESLRSVRPCRVPVCHKRPAAAADASSKRHCPWLEREAAVALREQAVAQRERAAAQHEATLVAVARRLEIWQAELRQRDCDGRYTVAQGLPYCS